MSPTAVRRLAVLLGVATVLGGWLGVRGLQIRSHLLEARTELALLSSSASDVDAALRASERAARYARQARDASHDPVWRLAAAVPVLGRSFAVVSGAAEVSDQLMRTTLPPLREALEKERSRSLVQHGKVDLSRLAQVTVLVRRASEGAEDALREAEQLPSQALPSFLGHHRRDLLAEVRSLNTGLRDARVALELAPSMLGRDAPRRYFMAVQNNAESRATGGLIGAYAILRADNGRITRERVGTDQDFKTASRPVVDLGPEFAAHYDKDATRKYWSGAVLTPDWSSAGPILAGLWQAQGGGRVDGVIGIDPIVMRELLRATGPVTVSGRRVAADNVVDFVMRDEYVVFGNDHVLRKQVLRELAASLFDRVLTGSPSSALLPALARAGGSGHLQLWSRHADEQRTLSSHQIGGTLPQRPGAFLEVVTQNAAGNKMDYYIRRKVHYSRPAPGRGRVELTLTNLVNPVGLPEFVIGRLDGERGPPGQTKLLLTFYASVGSEVEQVTVDGRPVPIERGREKGHGYGTLKVLVSPGRPVKVVAEVTDPGGPLTYRQQPLVVDDDLLLLVPRSD